MMNLKLTQFKRYTYFILILFQEESEELGYALFKNYKAKDEFKLFNELINYLKEANYSFLLELINGLNEF